METVTAAIPSDGGVLARVLHHVTAWELQSFEDEDFVLFINTLIDRCAES